MKIGQLDNGQYYYKDLTAIIKSRTWKRNEDSLRRMLIIMQIESGAPFRGG